MIKALIRKQLWQWMSTITRNAKTGKKRSAAGMVGYGLLFLYVFVVLAFSFVAMSMAMCEPLHTAGLDGLYFAILATLATVFGLVGSAFATYSGLYEAKDNELLLSLPIPPAAILGVRMFSLYTTTLAFEAIVMIPAIVVYCMVVGTSALTVIFGILTLVILPLIAQGFSCILGWIIALVASRLKRKSLVTVILSLAFIAVYYYGYSYVMSEGLEQLIANAGSLNGIATVWLYPLYQMGLGLAGNPLSYLIFAAIALAFFGVIYAALSASFLRIATMKKGAANKAYRKGALSAASARQACLRRELLHFWNSATYMMNCGLGSVLLIAGAVALIIKRGDLMSLMTGAFGDGFYEISGLIGAGAITMILAMNIVTAPSISLEGKTLWLSRSLPVSTLDILAAKVRLHLWVSVIPAMIAALVIDIVAVRDPLTAVMLVLLMPVFTLYTGLSGLAIGLKMPNLHWVSEAVAVKQGAATIVAMLGNWAVILLLGGAYFGLSAIGVSAGVFFTASVVLLALGDWLLWRWLGKTGCRLFEAL